MTTTSSTALPVSAIPVERFVERLYAPLAWEATVRLADPAIASRLVERELHRAWDERERFATFEALYRHVQDSALAAIERESDRRREVTRFDGDDTQAPGSLDLMSVDAVRRRIGEGRKPAPTPPAVIAVTAPAPKPVAATVAPTPPAHLVPLAVPERTAERAPERAPERPQERSVHKPRLSMGAARIDAPAVAPPRRSRATGPMNRFTEAQRPRLQLTDDQRKLAIGGGVLLTALLAMFAVSGGPSGDPQARAFAALSDSAGPTHESPRARLQQVPLAEGDTAQLGAGASLSTNQDYGDGARALRLAGPVGLSLRTDSSALAAIQYGVHRFITAGAIAAFGTDAAGRVVVQVDSGDIILVRDSVRVRLSESSVVRIGTGTPMPLTRDQRDAAFAWRQGRLKLRDESLRTIATAAKQWFDVELRFPADRTPSDTASLDVPLARRDSLASALEASLGARAEIVGDRITFKAISAGQAARTTARTTATRRGPVLAPIPNINMPPMPTIPPSEDPRSPRL